MIIQINKYDPEAFKFAQAYLKAEYGQWFSTPLHRLVSVEFLRKLENGNLDSNSYDIKFNPSRFDGEECLLLLRYYEKHNDMHKFIFDTINHNKDVKNLPATLATS